MSRLMVFRFSWEWRGYCPVVPKVVWLAIGYSVGVVAFV